MADNSLKCSFCSKPQDAVLKLIAGPGVYICDECVDLCDEILADCFVQRVRTAHRNAATYKEPVNQISVLSDRVRSDQLVDRTVPTELLKRACDAIESLFASYADQAQSVDVEPMFRMLLFAKRELLGDKSPELLPVLSELTKFYTDRNQLSVTASLLSWIIKISEETKAVSEDQIRAYNVQLGKIYARLGRTDMVELILDTLMPIEAKAGEDVGQ